MVSDVVNQLSLSNAAGWGAAAGFGAGVTPARLCSGYFTFFPPQCFPAQHVFSFTWCFSWTCGCRFPMAEDNSPSYRSWMIPSPPWDCCAVLEHPETPWDLSSNPAHGGKQPSATCRAGTAGHRESRRMISWGLFSEEENSMEKHRDLPTQEAQISTAKSLHVGLETC